jgi:hypothetical protein
MGMRLLIGLGWWEGVCIFFTRARSLIFFQLGCVCAFAGGGQGDAADVLYLTWIHDPTTTMTVQWHTLGKGKEASEVLYRQAAGGGSWLRAGGLSAVIPKTNVVVHTVELDGLEPGARYEFKMGEKGGVYAFQTLPEKLEKPLRFVMGGDAYFYKARFEKMNAQIAAQDPDFVVVGGDIAYTNNSRAVFKGREWELKRWRTFLREWKRQMVTSDGRIIPLLPVLGNHDIGPAALTKDHRYFLFYELFALPDAGVSFRTLDAGEYLSLILLDTGHSYHIEGTQTEWLKKALSERERISYKFASYHIGAYPSVYPYQGAVPAQIRNFWSPLFERYHLSAAFEHHNHAYKRSRPMKRGRINSDGVVYLGDGSWGVKPRKPKALWYLDKTAQMNAVCLVTLRREECLVEALNSQGEVFDTWRVKPTSKATAWNEAALLQYN